MGHTNVVQFMADPRAVAIMAEGSEANSEDADAALFEDRGRTGEALPAAGGCVRPGRRLTPELVKLMKKVGAR
jgi:hypothetical protein